MESVAPKPEHNERLLKERNVWIATTRSNGKPHLVPIWFVWVRERFYICTAENSVKVKNLRHSAQASVALENGDAPVVAEGAVQLLERPFAEDIAALFQQKYQWDISADNQYSLLIEVTPIKWLSW